MSSRCWYGDAITIVSLSDRRAGEDNIYVWNNDNNNNIIIVILEQ